MNENLLKKFLHKQLSTVNYSYHQITEGIELNSESIWEFKFGESVYKISCKKLNNNLEQIVSEQYKFISILKALDQIKLKVNLNKQLEKFGIIDITCPADYQTINARDIIFIDNKEKNCQSVVSLGGFTAIVADTKAANPQREICDTYIPKIIAKLPNEVINQYLGFKQSKIFNLILKKSTQEINIHLVCKNQEEKEIRKQIVYDHFKHEDSFPFTLNFDRASLNDHQNKNLIIIFERNRKINYYHYTHLIRELKVLCLIDEYQEKNLLKDILKLVPHRLSLSENNDSIYRPKCDLKVIRKNADVIFLFLDLTDPQLMGKIITQIHELTNSVYEEKPLVIIAANADQVSDSTILIELQDYLKGLERIINLVACVPISNSHSRSETIYRMSARALLEVPQIKNDDQNKCSLM